MCGVLGYVGDSPLPRGSVDTLVRHSQQRGRDSSGLIVHDDTGYTVLRADFALTRLARKLDLAEQNLFFGHSRLTTNGFGENQPVLRDDVCVIHNGIVVQHAEELTSTAKKFKLALQDHNNPVRYRNIWIRPLKERD